MSLSKFDRCVTDATDEALKLRALEAKGRLSAAAFLAEACKNANLDEAGLAEVEARIASAPSSSEATRAFVQKLQKEFLNSNWVRPSPNVSKMLRVYAREEIGAELTGLGIAAAALVAVAAKAATSRAPGRFGRVEDWDAHDAALADARQRLSQGFELMRLSWAGVDLTISEKIGDQARADGRLVARLRKWPSVVIHAETPWPQLVIEHAVLEHDAGVAALAEAEAAAQAEKSPAVRRRKVDVDEASA